MLATGTEATIPPIPASRRAALDEQGGDLGADEPPASLTVIGSGAIGIEFAQIYARFGSRVTVLEALPSILPAEDEEAAASLVPAFEEEGIALLGVKITRRATDPTAGRSTSRAATISTPTRSSSPPGGVRCSIRTTSTPRASSCTRP